MTKTPTPAELLKIAAANQTTTKARKPLNRLTAMLTVHHEVEGEAPSTVVANYDALLADDGADAWTRRVKVGPAYVDLASLGVHVDTASMLVVVNKGVKRVAVPTADEKASDAAQIIAIRQKGIAEPFALVRPGRFYAAEPFEWRQVEVKCLDEGTTVSFHLIPR